MMLVRDCYRQDGLPPLTRTGDLLFAEDVAVIFPEYNL